MLSCEQKYFTENYRHLYQLDGALDRLRDSDSFGYEMRPRMEHFWYICSILVHILYFTVKHSWQGSSSICLYQ